MTNTTTSLIKEKKARLELLEELLETLDREESYVKTKTVWFDTDKPRYNEDGTVKTRKDGTTVYEQDYRMEDVPEDELREDDKIKLTAIQTIRNQLEKMI